MPSEGCVRCNETGVALEDGHLCGRCHTILFTAVSELSARAVLEESTGDVVYSAVVLPSGRIVAETGSDDALETFEDAEAFEDEIVTEDRVVVDG